MTVTHFHTVVSPPDVFTPGMENLDKETVFPKGLVCTSLQPEEARAVYDFGTPPHGLWPMKEKHTEAGRVFQCVKCKRVVTLAELEDSTRPGEEGNDIFLPVL